MVGNVAALATAISNAFDVEHGTTSQRDAIAEGIAQAISDYLETVDVVIPSCNQSGPGTHPTGSLE